MWIAFSVDLEPNKDGTLSGVRNAIEWVNETVPTATFYTTYRIAIEAPDLVASLADDHEIGVHVHPREFGHDHDQLAVLPVDRQHELITTTREELATAAGIDEGEILSFRAGRHSASQDTFSTLTSLDFAIDASINVTYREHLPRDLTYRVEPFAVNDLFEIPTTHIQPSVISLARWRTFPSQTLTATASTLRSDSRVCSGLRAMQSIFDAANGVSMYMHPYDATTYHRDLENNGQPFRRRVESLLDKYRDEIKFYTASGLRADMI